MSEETLDVTEDVTPPADAQTATTEQEITPELVNDDTANSTEDKTPSRAEQRIQQLVGEKNNYKDFAKIAERERDFYKQQVEAAAPKQEAPKPLSVPKLEDYDHDTEAWSNAMVSYSGQMIDLTVNDRVQQAFNDNQARIAQDQVETAWQANVSKFSSEHQDFNEVAFATNEIYDVIKSLDQGPEIAYWLGNNPVEAERIGRLPVSQQAFALGQVPLSQVKPTVKQKQTTQAPEPLSPVGGQQADDSIPANESIDDYMKRMSANNRGRRTGR